jgi:UDP-N-acetylmuramoylalanine--D-glutamate ligase
MTHLSRRRIAVIGAGRTGQSVARFLVEQGAKVTVFERSPSTGIAAQLPAGVAVCGDDDAGCFQDVDLVVPSPGIRRDHPLLAEAERRRIPIWSEIELASRFLSCPLLAVTGTNGKSTTTVLLGAMLSAAGTRTFVGGNLGTPLIDAVSAAERYEAAVVEVSSFQLEWIGTFRASVAVLLNLTPDHQDRYPTFADYGEAKARLLETQAAGDYAVLNRDDAWVWEQRQRTAAAVISFGRDPVEFGTFVDGGEIVVWGPAGLQRYALDESPLRGEHNRENIQAAVTAATAWGVPPGAIRAALRSTRALPHRLELVCERRGVAYYDDSKGTNVGAVEKSLLSFPGGIVLLLGGHDKGGDFGALERLVRDRVSRLVCFGAAGPEIAVQLGAAAPCEVAANLSAAVERAAAVARPGQTVLLSPGCASFDEFRDYHERGQCFRALAEGLE